MVDIGSWSIAPEDVETGGREVADLSEVAYEDEDESDDESDEDEEAGGEGAGSGVAGDAGGEGAGSGVGVETAEAVEAGPASDMIERYYQEKLDKKGRKPGAGGAPGGGDAGEGAGAADLAELFFALLVQQFGLN